MMMSTVPTFSFAEPGLVNQISDFQTGFTPWELDCADLFPTSHLEPVIPSPCSAESKTGSVRINSSSGSVESLIGSIKTNSGSDDSDCFQGVPSPQSHELDLKNTRIHINATDHDRKKSNRSVLQVTNDDRKRKRMESNRESAKRSRMRKQRHIENLNDEVNRLGLENRELRNRLRIVLYHIKQISTENNQLLSEQEILTRRFSEMRQILVLRQLHQNSSLIINHQTI